MDSIFGLNTYLLDTSLQCMYTEMGQSTNNKLQSCKENSKFSTIDIYVADELFKLMETEADFQYLPEDNKYIMDIEKLFLFKKYKVILRIAFEDFNDVENVELRYKEVQTGKNFVGIIENDIPYKSLENFFQVYTDYISYRKVMNGTIKDNYVQICKLIIFNSKMYGYDLETGRLNFVVKETLGATHEEQ